MDADQPPQRTPKPVRQLHCRRVRPRPLRDFRVKVQPLAGGQLCLHIVKQGVPAHGASVGAGTGPVNPQLEFKPPPASLPLDKTHL